VAGFVQDHIETNNKVSSATNLAAQIGLTPNNVGNLLVARIVFDNTSATAPVVNSIAKPAGETNSWVRIAQFDSSTATAGSGVRGEMWAILTTVVWPASSTYQITLSAAVTAKACQLREYNGASTTIRGTAGTATSTTGVPAPITSGTAPVAGDLVLGFAGWETRTTATQDTTHTLGGAWAAGSDFGTSGSSAATNVEGLGSWKVPTVGGQQQYAPTCTSTDSGACVVVLVPAATIFSGAATLTQDSALNGDGFITQSAAAALAQATVLSGAGTVTTPGGGGGGTVTRKALSSVQVSSVDPTVTSFPVPVAPLSLAVDDLMVATVVTNGGVISSKAGWTDIVNLTTVSNPKHRALYKFADAADVAATTIDFPLSTATYGEAVIETYTGVDSSNPLDFTPTVLQSTVTITAFDLPAGTVVTADTLLIGGVAANTGTTTVGWTQPIGWTTTFDPQVPIGTAIQEGKSHNRSYGPTGTLAGSTGTISWTLSSARAGSGWMTGLRPAPGGSSTANGAATLTQASALIAAAVVEAQGAATLVQSSTLSATALRTLPAAATLTQPSAIVAAGFVVRLAAATLTQSSTLSATGTVSKAGAATLAQTSSLAAVAFEVQFAVTVLAQASTLSAAPLRTLFGAASLTQASVLASATFVVEFAAVTLVQTSVLTAVGVRTTFGGTALSQPSAMSAVGLVTTFGAAALVQTSVLTAAGTVVSSGVGAILTQPSTMSSVGLVTRASAATLVQTSILAGAGFVTTFTTAALSQTSVFVAGALRTVLPAATLVQLSTIAAAATTSTTAGGAAALTQLSTLNASGFVVTFGTANLAQVSTINATAGGAIQAATTMSNSSVLVVGALRTVLPVVSLVQGSVLSASATLAHLAGVVLVQASTFTASALITRQGAVALTQSTQLLAGGFVVQRAAAALIQTSTLTASTAAPIVIFEWTMTLVPRWVTSTNSRWESELTPRWSGVSKKRWSTALERSWSV
jgi:hypothetical protein